jgi:ketosteroid isomerase-like protein
MSCSDHPRADERQIRALLQTRLAALCAKDASQFVAAFDASIVKFDLAPPLQESGSGVLDPAVLQWWLSTWDGELTVELADLTTRTDDEAQDMWTRSTLGLRKIDDAWKITHEHNSAPFYMDGSVRPALDLLP